ncbi:MAG: hypothetical protein JWO80_1204 [Bryobacterales bacterium]|nr:hypothetical protein [Bryobacterales bacterium]
MNEVKQFLCSHLVALSWNGRGTSANMEKIWSSGATLNAEECIEAGTRLRIESPRFLFDTRVVKCTNEPDGHFIDVEFEGGYEWTPELFEPDHLTDPDILLVRKLLTEISSL